MPSAQYWIEKLNLISYGKGGWFRETYRAAEMVAGEALPQRFGGERAFSTAIYFLLEGEQFSPLHRLDADEAWHFYAGGPLALHLLLPEGGYKQIILGPDAEAGQVFQAVVPAGCWFGGHLLQAGMQVHAPSFALAGCTVAPGFDPADYAPADRAALLAQYPAQREVIERLTLLLL